MFEDLGAELGVALDDRELLVGELRGLAEDAVGDAHLADVVQPAGELHTALWLLGEAELAGHHLGVAPDRLGVPRAAAEA